MDRKHLVEALVAWRGDPRHLCSELQAFPFDAQVPVATLRKDDVAAALKRFLSGQATAEDVEAWADSVEGRDDIAYSALDSKDIAEVLFVLSTPDVHGKLTPQVAKLLAARLGYAF